MTVCCTPKTKKQNKKPTERVSAVNFHNSDKEKNNIYIYRVLHKHFCVKTTCLHVSEHSSYPQTLPQLLVMGINKFYDNNKPLYNSNISSLLFVMERGN